MKKIYNLLLVAASALAFSACQENNIEIVETPGDSIQVEILSSSYATKSADSAYSKVEPVATYRLSDEGDKPLYLHVYKSLNRDLPFSAAPETKGAEITLDSLKKDASGFSIEGYLGDGKPTDASVHFLSESVVYSSGQWLMSTEYPWLAGVPTTFWSYYPSSTASINGTRAITLPGDTDEQDEISFTYTLPTPAASSPFNDAKNQQDLLFAYNNRTWAKGQTGKIGIMFEHALAAIKFDVSEVTSSFSVSNIAFKDIHSSGTCVASASSDSTVFAWSDLGALLKYSQDFTDADFEGGVQNRSKSDKMFFVIPQALESTAEIEVTFTPASGQTSLTSQVKSLPIDQVWEAGYVYTYELSYNPFSYQVIKESVDVSVKTYDNVHDADDNAFFKF